MKSLDQAMTLLSQAWFSEGLRCSSSEWKSAYKDLEKNYSKEVDVIEEQKRTIQSLTMGCEDYGLDGTTAIIVYISRLEQEIENLKEKLSC